MIFKSNQYEIAVDGEKFFQDDEAEFLSFQIFERGSMIFDGVIWNQFTTSEDLMAHILLNIHRFKTFPSVRKLPEPLKTVVKKQYESESGMYFYCKEDNECLFSEAELEKLLVQSSKYSLEDVLKVSPDSDECITAYMALCERFNFAYAGY